jgi:transposase
MAALQDNSARVKRLRELKATLRNNRSRLLVGLDIAQAEHVVHLRHAHTRVAVPTLTIPNSTRGFTALWVRIQQAQRATGCREVVCGLEPTGTYHHAVATFLVAQGADVVLLSSRVAYWNRWTQDATLDKNDPKDAGNGADLLEQGKVLFCSQPTGALAELRRLVRCLRRARTALAACKARWRTILRPALAPMGEPLPQRLWAALPAVLQAWERAAPGRLAIPTGRLPLGLATACADLGTQVTTVQARIAAIEQTLTPVAERLPAYALLRSIPGVWGHRGRHPSGRDRRHRLVRPVLSAPEARGPRHRPGAVGAVRRTAADLQVRPGAPALGVVPCGGWLDTHGGGSGPARRAQS